MLELLLLLRAAELLLHPVAAELLLRVRAILLIARPATAISLVALLVSATIFLVALLLSTILLIALLSSVALSVALLFKDVFAHLAHRARHDIVVCRLFAASHRVLLIGIILVAHQGAVARLDFVPLREVVATRVVVVILFQFFLSKLRMVGGLPPPPLFPL